MNIVTQARELLAIKEFYPNYLNKARLEEQNIIDIYDEDFTYVMFEREYQPTAHAASLGVVVMIPTEFDHDALVFLGGKFAYMTPWSAMLDDDCKKHQIELTGTKYE